MNGQGILFLHSDSKICDELTLILQFIGQNVTQCCVDKNDIATQSWADLKLIIISYDLEQSLFQKALDYALLRENCPIVIYGNAAHFIEQYDQVIDVIEVPTTRQHLLTVLHRCQRYNENWTREHTQISAVQGGLVGESPSMSYLRELIVRVATKNINVLLTGESGTGKELAARSIHRLSGRNTGPFVPINCGAIPSELLESELFGHEKGAFTGAISARKGRFELAQGGTLFLDEIGDMPLAMQVKLLRVLQERKFERIGGTKSIDADVRIIAATHCDLEAAVKNGKFREDLYYRLNVFPVQMPALRDRVDDLPLLTAELIGRFKQQHQCAVSITQSAMLKMKQYRWPGNIRELGNLIERFLVLAPNGVIDVNDLPMQFQQIDNTMAVINKTNGLPDINEGIDLKAYMLAVEVGLIKKALEQSAGVVAHAAKLLKIRRTTLVEKMRKYDLKRLEEATN